MLKRIFFVFLLFVLFFQPVHSASALEGLVKFTGKKNATVFLEIAATVEQKQKGLMNRPSLAGNRGMVFVFRPARTVTFWMKDTLISLDMIFINKGKIVNIVKNALPNQTHTVYPSVNEATEVVEVNGGFSDAHMINIGDRISFENISQIDYSVKSNLMVISR